MWAEKGGGCGMHDVAGFRRAWATLSEREKQGVGLRCAGLTSAQIADRRFVTGNTIKNQVNRAIEKMRAVPELRDMAATGVVEAVCWRLGYEQALADIETTMARERAA